MDSKPTEKPGYKEEARPLKGGKKKKAPSMSPRRKGSASPRGPPRRKVMGGSPRLEGIGGAKHVNEYNEEFIKQLKSPAVDLRQTGADVEADPTLELGLLLDCTSSMSSWIVKAKKTLTEIVDKAIKECEEDGSLKCRVSFVGYRDIKDQRRFEVMSFSDDIDAIKAFISKVSAVGGDDMPEDMQGGLKLCLLQDWTEEATKRVVIVTDAPPHGKQYHNTHDDYPGGSPEGILIEDLMKEFCKKDIDFQVIKLNNSVDKMVEVMKANHQEVEVVDMSGVKEEMRVARMAAVEAEAHILDADTLKVRRAEAAMMPSTKEVEEEMESRFVKGTTKGIGERVKAKKKR